MAQPIVDLKTDEVPAWEPLLRLHDGKLPELPSSAFLPTAERSSLATRVDRWVVGRAIAVRPRRAAERGRQPAPQPLEDVLAALG
jgi:EAL domain-containing protein (putative c-di-GMP-specific phosphodiesterase class I)